MIFTDFQNSIMAAITVALWLELRGVGGGWEVIIEHIVFMFFINEMSLFSLFTYIRIYVYTYIHIYIYIYTYTYIIYLLCFFFTSHRVLNIFI